MKSLSSNHQESLGNTHETVADLTFCALVVLVLFVLTLIIEVSQRVRADRAAAVPVEEVKEEQLLQMSPEELAELSRQLREQQQAIAELKAKLKSNAEQVENTLAAMTGEQRFTGAREPAAIVVCYDYNAQRYYFVPSKSVAHADRQQSGESTIEYVGRKTKELVAMALEARKSRGYTLREARAIYIALTKYDEVVEAGGSFQIDVSHVAVYYHVLLSQYIAGDTSGSHEAEVEFGIQAFSSERGKYQEGLYPVCVCQVNTADKTITISEVVLSATDLRGILLSVSGRGVMLDFQGYSGKPPQWLYDEVLMPSGYISKTPKLPAAVGLPMN
jgi:hypothetical protein